MVDSDSAPQINLPKGGGAIQGIGETFAANPVTGTATLTVPVAASPGRAGFTPRLALAYDSGNGNGPFGMGWSLSLPSITRRTDRGLPQYQDADESDTFILSGHEDLVPALVETSPGAWERRIEARDGYRVTHYRPRVEGLFSVVERWTRASDGDMYWRSISKDNVTTYYGRTAASRVADPLDPRRVFTWLIDQSQDDTGNVMVYEYASESSDGVGRSQSTERNRTDLSRSANRYLKRIKYGNTPSLLSAPLAQLSWLFEIVFDYGEGHYAAQPPDSNGQVFATASVIGTAPWPARPDAFSRYRAGFEVRTYRLCRRVLAFHHFENELGVPDYLVRSTELTYQEGPVASLLTAVTQSGFVRQPDGRYLVRWLPAVEFEYSKAVVQSDVRDVDPASLVNLPSNVDGGAYRWLDLDGEGSPCVLAEQGDGWYYKRNLTALSLLADAVPTARFETLTEVTRLPGLAEPGAPRHEFLDLDGDGHLDCVVLDRPVAGFYERGTGDRWQPFAPLASAPNVDWNNPNLRLIDVDGDGHTDILVTEHDAFTCFSSLADDGFDRPQRVPKATDEERGPAIVFADGAQSIFLADMSGDGLTDIVRIRNGEVCYWPNLGYGRFGAKVNMDAAPWFDRPDSFEPRRLRLADVDGSGVTDMIYLAADGVRLYSNQSGNAWSAGVEVANFPPVDTLASIQALDLFGNGTSCLVWTSPLPSAAGPSMRYIDLMGAQKPYLLVRTMNNLGAETRIAYAPSTAFHLADRAAGRPWVTRLPFPVQVVERVDRYDRVSRNRFVSRYVYHHGYFDGTEREYRGFGMVEQRDTEELGLLLTGGFPSATNIDAASYVPPVVTKTWFHTGVYPGGPRISRLYEAEYYQEPGFAGLADSVLPDDVTGDEIHEALRSLKGAILRQEVYADDGGDTALRPYSVLERNYTIDRVQPFGPNRHAIFFSHARESVTCSYERQAVPDPRALHTMSLAVDDYGNELASATIAYGRRADDPDPLLTADDRAIQRTVHATYVERTFTNAILEPDAFRPPLLAETRRHELVKVAPSAAVPNATNLFSFGEIIDAIGLASDGAHDLPYTDFAAAGATASHPYRRLIEHIRTLYRANDLSGGLPLGTAESMALPFVRYQRALDADVLALYQRGSENLLPTPATVLGTEGGYVLSDGAWWTTSGQTFYSPNASDTAPQELAVARAHFFVGRRYRNPFANDIRVTYDSPYDLLINAIEDAATNTMTAQNDYRVLSPAQITDPNGNRSAVAFDGLGIVVATAVMGKTSENVGDALSGVVTDLTQAQVDAFFAAPRGPVAATLLGDATTRFVYDVDRFQRLTGTPSPAYAATIARETHVSDLEGGAPSRLQVRLSYSDGFRREIQRKAQAEPGPLVPSGPTVDPRWVASGWTLFNNKGKPVRQYEPFFTATHDFTYGVTVGVTPTLLYDPLGRAVATLHPNHAWQKVVLDPWRQESWDVNDTALIADPSADADVGAFFQRLPSADCLPTWYAQRSGGALGADEQAAAARTAVHAGTPNRVYLDTLGQSFLLLIFNRAQLSGPPVETHDRTAITFDIQGRQRVVVDALGRTLVANDFDMAGAHVHQTSLDAGERWMLADVMGKALREWDSRAHQVRHTYDALRRPVGLWLTIGSSVETLAERTVYGEGQPSDQALNLRGRMYKAFDSAGIITNDRFDFTGNLLSSTRQLVADFTAPPDWLLSPALSGDSFVSSWTFDALNRPITIVSPDGSVTRPTYNDAALLSQLVVHLGGAATATPFVTDITYDARGQRTTIAYGSGAGATYRYEPTTLRLAGVTTERTSDGATLQDWTYTYDPIGNITHVADAAQQTLYFANAVVNPSADYVYDARYRLIQAQSRELIGLAAVPQPTDDDTPRMHQPLPADGSAVRNYTDTYQYDGVGNLLSIAHTAPGGNWTCAYAYPATNRLTSTTVGATTYPYAYDAHGNMTAMPHLALMAWNFKDQLQSTQQQAVITGPGERTYYLYNSAGIRVRKVTVSGGGALLRQRIYVGSFEVYREYAGNAVTLERQTLHVMDGKNRIALVDTATVGGTTPATLRYQLANHLGSCCLELDASAAIISYEEYYPYGSTSYQGGRAVAEVSLKRYRYIGKERDTETGFYYHGARYYASWLGRWISCDPLGVAGGSNVYAAVNGNPIVLVDPSGLQNQMIDGGVGDKTAEQLANGGKPTMEYETPKEATPTDTTPPPPPPPPETKVAPPKKHASQPAPTAATIDKPPESWLDPDDEKFLTFDLDPDKVTLPDLFMGFYGIGYDIKQGIYKPIRNWLAPQQKLYLDSENHVQVSHVPQDHTDALIAVAQVGSIWLPETRMGLGPKISTGYIRFEGQMVVAPSDANFLRINVEWAQEDLPLIRGERQIKIDTANRALARNEIDALGIDRSDLQAMHPLDSVAAGRFIQPGTELGTTYYFGNKSVNMAFGAQLGNEVNRLGVRLGQEFRIEFVDFPSYTAAPPNAPPASSPNLFKPR